MSSTTPVSLCALVVAILAGCGGNSKAPRLDDAGTTVTDDGPGAAPDSSADKRAAEIVDARVADIAAPRDQGDTPGDARVVRDSPGERAAEAGEHSPSLCAASALAVCESFETTATGALPASWGRRAAGYGGKSMTVATDDAARGTHALKIEGGLNGSQFLEYRGTLGALATEHYGRVFFKVKTPAPWPASDVLHGDIIQHIGPHPGGGTNGVRWGVVENTAMKFQWIFNVQPTEGEGEWADGTNYDYIWPGTWQCLEWHYAQPAQTGTLWLDGVQLPIQVGKSHAPEIPTFTSLGVGWANYQNAPGQGFVVWIDEVAFDGARIGCDR